MSEPLEMNVDFETSDTEMNMETDMNCNIKVPLPIASATQLGGIKVGENLSIAPDGTLSAEASPVVVDDTLTIAGAAADAKKTGDEISGLKEDISNIESAVYTYKQIQYRSSASYPTGWRTGYYTKTVGEQYSTTGSNNYMRLYYLLAGGTDFDDGCLFLKFTPPSGYYFIVKTVDNDGIILAEYTGVNNLGEPMIVPHQSGQNYCVSFGNLNGTSSAAITDTAFISTIKIFEVQSATLNGCLIDENETWED